tara:strand:- start:1351 stop:1527 length:177 start_codon:yes stop_codon:yes gene_type:complete
MKMAKVTVEGRGMFEISNEKIAELLSWLATNQGVAIRENNTVKEVSDNKFTGRELLEG